MSTHDITHKWQTIKGFNVSINWEFNENIIMILSELNKLGK